MNSGTGLIRRRWSWQSTLVMRHKRTAAERSDFFYSCILVLVSHPFLEQKQSMLCWKAKWNTTNRERYNALCALNVHMREKVQKLWALCALQLKTIRQMLMVSIMLELDHDGDFFMLLFVLWSHCIQSCIFFQQLDNLLMVINPDQVIPCLNPPNRHQMFDLLHEGWCYQHIRFCVVQLRELYHLLEYPAMFTVSMKCNLASYIGNGKNECGFSRYLWLLWWCYGVNGLPLYDWCTWQ